MICVPGFIGDAIGLLLMFGGYAASSSGSRAAGPRTECRRHELVTGESSMHAPQLRDVTPQVAWDDEPEDRPGPDG